MDHAQLPAIDSAQLPKTYEHAKTALAECSTIDECKDWADKAAALASYAKQAKDDSLRKMAERIQARAIRRAGELLQQLEKGNKHSVKRQKDGAVPLMTRKQAADDAGMSTRQRKTALRVANVPADEFTEMIDSESPPTITKLAEAGTKKYAVDLKGRDPKEFNNALHFVAAFERWVRDLKELESQDYTEFLNEAERERLRNAIHQIDAVQDKIITRI